MRWTGNGLWVTLDTNYERKNEAIIAEAWPHTSEPLSNRLIAFVLSLVAGAADQVGNEDDEDEAGESASDGNGHDVAGGGLLVDLADVNWWKQVNKQTNKEALTTKTEADNTEEVKNWNVACLSFYDLEERREEFDANEKTSFFAWPLTQFRALNDKRRECGHGLVRHKESKAPWHGIVSRLIQSLSLSLQPWQPTGMLHG